MKKIFSEEEMKTFAEELAFRVQNFPEGGELLFLKGEVGAGKTTFTRYFSQALGATSASSPTFSFLEKREISENITIFHGDFYRGDISRIEDIMDEYLEMQEEEIQNRKQKNLPENKYIWILEWFPEELISEFFPDKAKIFLNFEHGETQKYREISLQFENPLSCSSSDVKYFVEKYKTPVHIKKHIELVQKIAVTVAQKLRDQKIPIDLELVKNSALLHDAVKYVDFPEYTPSEKKRYQEEITPEKLKIWKETKQKFFTTDHGKAIGEIITTPPYFFPATAKVIDSHMTRRIFLDTPMSWEEKCVHYADKRALHDTFVTITERLEDGKKRYACESSPRLNQLVSDLEKSLEKAGNFLGKNLVISQKNI